MVLRSNGLKKNTVWLPMLWVVLSGTLLCFSGAASAAQLGKTESRTEPQAAPLKTIRLAFSTAESGFDPPLARDLYSNTINEAIFERLLTYDYLARPMRLAPMTAEALPEVSDGGKTYTFKIRPGIRFYSDPAFNGKPRELTAADYVYSFKRVLDPKIRSPWAFMLEGKIIGLDALAETAKKTGRYDYDANVEGLKVLDRYTLQIRLREPDYNFSYIAAHTPFSAVAREVVEKYGDDMMAHPVGTGPYVLKQWTRGARIVLEKNPEYRGMVWSFAASEEGDAELNRTMQGKRLPLIDRVEISIIEEEQSAWLAFNRKELDFSGVGSFREKVFDEKGELKPEWREQGVKLVRAIDPEVTYTFFNFRDPVVGGFEKEKLALRRAIIMAYNRDEEIKVIRKGQAIPATMPIPVGVVGHDPRYKPLNTYNPALANKLLDAFGFKKGKDGFRAMPNGSPLLLKYATGTTAIERQFNELWKKSMDAIGVRVEFQPGKFADHIKATKNCQLQMWGSAWTADYPDGDNFMQLLYGPNVGQSNSGCYESKAFDAFYEASRKLPDSPERNHLFLEMTRQMEVDGAWMLGVSRERNMLIRPWVLGYKKHPILSATWIYLDIDPAKAP
ncbi:MAG: ABC transporter substrate-binding protein [Proteobacteria bacterium]|nr:ABC transporter substrate-binding protein [Pseudomonadota bacterium]